MTATYLVELPDFYEYIIENISEKMDYLQSNPKNNIIYEFVSNEIKRCKIMLLSDSKNISNLQKEIVQEKLQELENKLSNIN